MNICYDVKILSDDLLFEYYETEWDIAVYSITHRPTGIAVNKRLDMRVGNNPGTKEIQEELTLKLEKITGENDE